MRRVRRRRNAKRRPGRPGIAHRSAASGDLRHQAETWRGRAGGPEFTCTYQLLASATALASAQRSAGACVVHSVSPSPHDRSVGSAPHRTSTGEGRRLRNDDRRARSTTRWDTPLGRDGSDVRADVSDMARFAESLGACRIVNAAASPKGHRILTRCPNRCAGDPSVSLPFRRFF